MKNCPYCAEEIQDAAIKCRFCHERLDRPVASVPKKGVRGTGTLLAMFLVVGPFMLPMVWGHPEMPRQHKIAWTVGIVTVTLLLVWAVMAAINNMFDYYRLIGELGRPR